MMLHIDTDRCQGHGRCWDIAARLIDADDTGRGVVRVHHVEGADLDLAWTAVRACPEQAVVLGGNQGGV
jgi:ferredoxin